MTPLKKHAAVSNLYIQKTALPGGAPPELEIRLTGKVTDHQFPVRMQHQVGRPQKGGDSYFSGSWICPRWF